MDNALRQQVRARAGDRCEYCRLPQAGHDERFSVDHVVARKHGGADALENLALCCLRCNLHKGTDLTTLTIDNDGDAQGDAVIEMRGDHTDFTNFVL